MIDQDRDPNRFANQPPPDDQVELNQLIRANNERRLTDPERLRLAALTWTPDPNMEAARILRERHPDLADAYRLAPGLETYEKNRTAAVAGGRTVADPSPAAIDEIDRAAEAWRATIDVPAEIGELDAAWRSRFAESVEAGDLVAMLAVWRGWLAAVAKADAFHRRRQAALAAFGRPQSVQRQARPNLVAELERVFGGETTAQRNPVSAMAFAAAERTGPRPVRSDGAG